jgi:hypothetical protein
MILDFALEIALIAHPGELKIGKIPECPQGALNIGVGRMVAPETIDDDFNHG